MEGPLGSVNRIKQRKLTSCHTERFGQCVTFADTPQKPTLRIKAQAVVSRIMPPGNVTEMTDAERDLIARWVNQGGRLE